MRIVCQNREYVQVGKEVRICLCLLNSEYPHAMLKVGKCANSLPKLFRCANSLIKEGRCANSLLKVGMCANSLLKVGRFTNSLPKVGSVQIVCQKYEGVRIL